jgi:hypothetical protein
MPIFHFDIADSVRLEDPVGLSLSGVHSRDPLARNDDSFAGWSFQARRIYACQWVETPVVLG